MITKSVVGIDYNNGVRYVRFDGHCLSTDTKPVANVLNGSSLIEMDTGIIYFFDEESGSWLAFGEEE